jgi:putative restriction endonuclease
MIGEIPGIEEGANFTDRQALNDAGVHRGNQAGIGGGGEAVVLSGGYVDDVDSGDVIIYTGQGGRDPESGRQVRDQELTRGNRALADNHREGNPIRVSRGAVHNSPFAPNSGYQYGGLYRIESFWSETGGDGYLIWRFRLVKISSGEQIQAPSQNPPPTGTEAPERNTVYVTRVVRSSEVGNYVKNLYGYHCQISGERLDTPKGHTPKPVTFGQSGLRMMGQTFLVMCYVSAQICMSYLIMAPLELQMILLF